MRLYNNKSLRVDQHSTEERRLWIRLCFSSSAQLARLILDGLYNGQ